jgi:hypothetical protein
VPHPLAIIHIFVASKTTEDRLTQIRSHDRAAKLEQYAAVEVEAQKAIFRFTHWIRDRVPARGV